MRGFLLEGGKLFILCPLLLPLQKKLEEVEKRGEGVRNLYYLFEGRLCPGHQL